MPICQPQIAPDWSSQFNGSSAAFPSPEHPGNQGCNRAGPAKRRFKKSSVKASTAQCKENFESIDRELRRQQVHYAFLGWHTRIQESCGGTVRYCCLGASRMSSFALSPPPNPLD